MAIWGHVHGGNLGDELVFSVIVQAIRGRLDARIVGITLDPLDTRERHGIDEAYPINPGSAGYGKGETANVTRPAAAVETAKVVIRKVPGASALRAALALPFRVAREIAFCWRSFRLLRQVDSMVVAGSGQLLDKWLGWRGHPYTTFRWATLCRLAGVPVSYPSVGAGPIEGKTSAFLIRSALRLAAYVSVRDAQSGRVLEEIGLPAPPRCPDMAFGFTPDDAGLVLRRDAPGKPLVGVNVMAYSTRGTGRGASRANTRPMSR